MLNVLFHQQPAGE